MQHIELIATTVQGMGYQFVEATWASAGLLRVTIDRSDGTAVTVDDCERVTRQLQYLLEVEGLEYKRLEVSSPGLDRLVRTPADFERFAGLAVDVSLRQPFQGRKKYRGILQAPVPAADGEAPTYSVIWDQGLLDELQAQRPGVKKKGPPARRAAAPVVPQELRFSLAEVREVRLVPVLDFRGRKS